MAMKINLVDQEIRRLQVQLKICQTARMPTRRHSASVTEGPVRRREVGCEQLHNRQTCPTVEVLVF